MYPRPLSGLIVLFIIALTAFSCNNTSDQHWIKAVPGYSHAVVLHHDNPSVTEVAGKEYMSFIEDMTNSAIPVASQIEEIPETSLQIKAVAAVPTRSDNWRPLWIADAESGFLPGIASHFHRDFAENEYEFKSRKIHILHTQSREIYAVQLNNWVIFSESSYAIEESIRTFNGNRPSFDYGAAELADSDLLLNFAHLDRWISQVGAVRYRPMLQNLFEGLSPALLNVSTETEDEREFRFTGPINTANPHSDLVSSIHHANSDLILDQYISSDASAFSITHSTPQETLPSDFEPFSALDSLLIDQPQIYSDIAQTLETRTAFVAYSDPDEDTSGEHVFLRHLESSQELYSIFEELASDGYVTQEDNSFYVQSSVLSKLIGGPLSNFEDFYIGTTWAGAILAQRSGLIERIRTERNQRRVMYYDDTYTQIRNQHPEEISAFAYSNNQDLFDYLQPMLNPNHRIGALTSRADIMAMSITQNGENELGFMMDTHRTVDTDDPYRERWVYPITDASLTGPPIAANTGRSSRDEIFFATEAGNVIGLGSDGTPVFNVRTGNDTPVGSPVIYDWYGNNQKMVIIAAGNKVYAWNSDGVSLPNFPVELDEDISAPIYVGDVARNGMNELLVATADRQLHVLDGRGNNIEGWPQSTNATIRSQPKLREVDGEWGVWAYAENGIHAWQRHGDRKSGYPVFADAPLQGDPTFYQNHLLASGANGELYAIGAEPLFEDTLAAATPTVDDEALDTDEITIQSLQISNESLTGNVQTGRLQVLSDENNDDDDNRETYDEMMFVVGDENGSVYAYNLEGTLRFTESMGRPVSTDQSPFIYDLGDTGSLDILALTQDGTLYGWDVSRNERITDLPSSAMQSLLLTDLYQDGRTEIIAGTGEGLRAWTISRIVDDPL